LAADAHGTFTTMNTVNKEQLVPLAERIGERKEGEHA
jgi:hypothetical protein